jgi:hypothetical protein
MDTRRFSDLLEGLAAVLTINLSPRSIDEYYKRLKDQDDNELESAIEWLKDNFESTPHKKFPHVHDITDRIHKARTKEYIAPPVANVEIAGCISAYMVVLMEIKRWHDLKLVKYSGVNCKPMDLDEWNNAGRPQSWSPILDHFMSGLYENRFHTFESFCREYLKKLVEHRNARMKGVCNAETVLA